MKDGTTTRIILAIALLVCGCRRGGGGRGDATGDEAVSPDALGTDGQGGACPAGEHGVDGVCVGDVFDEIELPGTLDATQMKDGRWIRRDTLLVQLVAQGAARADADVVAARLGGRVTGWIGAASVFLLAFDDGAEPEALEARIAIVAADAAVASATLDELVAGAASRKPSDNEQVAAGQAVVDAAGVPGAYKGAKGLEAYDLARVRGAWDQIWTQNPKLTPVRVAILDGEVVRDPVFASLPFRNAADLRVPEMKSTATGHGTAVASIAGAPTDGHGMNGVLGGLDCLSYDLTPVVTSGVVKDLDARERTYISVILAGLAKAVAAGARVVNLSQGILRYGDAMNAPLGQARRIVAGAKKVLFVMAVGNDTTGPESLVDAAVNWPSVLANTEDNVVAVAAVDLEREAVVTSNRDVGNGGVTLSAPGEKVLASHPNGTLRFLEETSAASPLVSGAAGLILAIWPEASGADVKQLLLQNNGGALEAPLHVLLDVQAAVTAALGKIPAERLGKGTCQSPPDVGSCGTGCVACIGGPSASLSMVCATINEKAPYFDPVTGISGGASGGPDGVPATCYPGSRYSCCGTSVPESHNSICETAKFPVCSCCKGDTEVQVSFAYCLPAGSTPYECSDGWGPCQ